MLQLGEQLTSILGEAEDSVGSLSSLVLSTEVSASATNNQPGVDRCRAGRTLSGWSRLLLK